MKFKQLTLNKKILLMLFGEIGALLLLFFVSQFFMERNNSLLTQIEGNFVPALELGRDMEQKLTEIQRAMQDAVAAADQELLPDIDNLQSEFLALLEQGNDNPFFEEQKLELLKSEFRSYYVLARKTTLILIEGKSLDEKLIAILETMRTQYNSLKNQLRSKTVKARKEVSVSFEEALQNSDRSAILMNIIIIAGTFAFGSLSFFLSRSITGPLRNLVHVTNLIARGDLSQAIAIRSGDELALLGNAMERMRSELQQFYHKLEQLVAERTQQLQESEARFRHVIASISDHIYMSDLTGDGQRIHRYLSPKIEMLTGYPADKFLSDPSFWTTLIVPEDRTTLHDQEARFRQGKDSEAEYRLRRADGNIIWLRDSGQAEQHGDFEDVTVYGVISDISERKQAEGRQRQLQDKLRQAQKLEAIGKLAGGTAHEFNNILAIMLGALELVISHLPEGSPERVKLEQAYRSGERGRDLVKEILIFSRSSHQKLEAVHLRPILQNAIKMVQSITPPTVEIRSHLEVLERLVLANSLQIEQIIINLCKNAIQAMPNQQGLIEVTLEQYGHATPHAEERNSCEQEYIRLTVKDNGSGMPAAVKEQMFDPFFTTKEIGQGTGLGLSVVHGIIQQHGAQVRVDSEPGQGTSFEILFPVIQRAISIDVPQKSLLDQPAEAPRSVSGEEHILIIDTDRTHLRLPVMALEKLGYTVNIISEAHEALALFRRNPEQVQLVMCALASTEEQGLQIFRELADIRPEIPLLMYAETQITFKHKEVEERGNVRFLQKPLKVRQLIQTVREMLVFSRKRRE